MVDRVWLFAEARAHQNAVKALPAMLTLGFLVPDPVTPR
jgi:hypothetical protein